MKPPIIVIADDGLRIYSTLQAAEGRFEIQDLDHFAYRACDSEGQILAFRPFEVKTFWTHYFGVKLAPKEAWVEDIAQLRADIMEYFYDDPSLEVDYESLDRLSWPELIKLTLHYVDREGTH